MSYTSDYINSHQRIIFDVDYENNDEGCDEAENEESDQANFRFLCIKFMWLIFLLNVILYPLIQVSPKANFYECDMGPTWLKPMLKANYFVTCPSHGDSNKSECNMFCLDCVGNALCSYCLIHHKDHRVVQVCFNNFTPLIGRVLIFFEIWCYFLCLWLFNWLADLAICVDKEVFIP